MALTATSTPSADCPPLTYYEAYQIVEGHDETAVAVALADFLNCSPIDNHGVSTATINPLIYAAAQRTMQSGDSEAHVALHNLDSVIHRMSILPGERVIAVISPGFFITPMAQEMSALIDHATKADIIVNTLDVRGLYTSRVFDAVESPNGDSGVPLRAQFIETEESLQADVLSAVADGTGGTYFHNRNDLDQELLLASTEPEVFYVLGFTPKIKPDGKYHSLKVSLKSKETWTIQARHGYFASKQLENPEQLAGEEIDQAISAREEWKNLPITCEIRFFKSDTETRLTVLTHIDITALKFRRVDDRNHDNLTVVIALFDDNGNFLSAFERKISFQLKDVTFTRLSKTGVAVKIDFPVQPGTFLVRVVARDSEGGQLGAKSQTVVIPN